jgi:hypothetical protein
VLCQLSYSHRHFDYSNCTLANVRNPHAQSSLQFQIGLLAWSSVVGFRLCKTFDFCVTDDLDFDFPFS